METKSKARIVLELFLTFLKIGAFTFGGGYAMIALLESEFVSKKEWLTKEEFLDIVAIAESTPGPIAINSATYIGCKMAGFFGSLLATLGVVLPSFAIIFVISLFFDRFLEIKAVAAAFRGIQVCVVYLIINAGIKLFKGLPKKALTYILFFAVLAAFLTLTLLSVKFSSVFYILIGGVVGLVVYLIGRRRQEGGEAE